MGAGRAVKESLGSFQSFFGNSYSMVSSHYVGVTFSDTNKKLFWIPEGFAHDFLVIDGPTEFTYKCTDVYDPAGEGGIPWDDPDIGIERPKLDCDYVTSAKDKEHD